MSSSESDFDRGEVDAGANVNHTEKLKQKPKSQKKHACPVCHKQFADAKGKRRHQKNKNHNPASKEKTLAHVCPVCNKKFAHEQSKRRHQKQENHYSAANTADPAASTSENKLAPKPQKIHECPVCNQQFANAKGKWRHQKKENHYPASTAKTFATYPEFLAWKEKIQSDHCFDFRQVGGTNE